MARRRVLVTRTREIEGVSYSRQRGVRCPGRPGEPCGRPRPHITRTMPWERGVRVRYHHCAECGATFKSIETDPQWDEDDSASAPAQSLSSLSTEAVHP